MSRRILIVEDEKDQEEILTRYLRFIGAEVDSAPSGREGIEMATRQHPDLILLDIGLPDMDGWEVLRTLRGQSETASCHYVAITGRRIPTDELLAAGFCAHLEKPIAPYQVMAQIERCVGCFDGTPARTIPTPPDHVV